jgi:hypothetical protein
MPRSTKRTNSNLSGPKQSIPPLHIPPPKQTISSPVYTPLQIKTPSMLDTVKQGFSFGVGSSIAHNMMNSIFNSKNKDETINTKEIKLTNEPKLTNDKVY